MWEKVSAGRVRGLFFTNTIKPRQTSAGHSFSFSRPTSSAKPASTAALATLCQAYWPAVYAFVRRQIADWPQHDGQIYNVGGGQANSLSLAELTALCGHFAGSGRPVAQRSETEPFDIPYYVSDNALVTATTGWQPAHDLAAIMDEVFRWLVDNRATLEPILGAA